MPRFYSRKPADFRGLPQAMKYRTGSTGRSNAKIGLFSGPGTRRWPRYALPEVPSIKGIHSDAGCKIKLLNLSRGGVLLQTRKRLPRGMTLHITFNTSEGTVPLPGLVLRSFISSPRGIPEYQAAVAFERPLQIYEESPESFVAATAGLLSPPRNLCAPERSHSSDDSFHCEETPMIAAFLAVAPPLAANAPPDELSGLNDW